MKKMTSNENLVLFYRNNTPYMCDGPDPFQKQMSKQERHFSSVEFTWRYCPLSFIQNSVKYTEFWRVGKKSVSFHCHPQTNAMTTSSKMDCGAVHTSSSIVKWRHALRDTTNQKSPAVLKKKSSGASKKKKGCGGPKPSVGVVPPLLVLHVLHPQNSKSLSLNVGCCFLCVFHPFFDFVLFDCCVCGCYSRNSTFSDFQMVIKVGFCLFYCCVIVCS